MKIFDAELHGIRYEFVCQWVNTRNGFKHTCNTIQNGYDVADCKVCYQNRTWESYEFQSVLHKAIDNLKLTDEDKQELKDQVDKNRGRG